MRIRAHLCLLTPCAGVRLTSPDAAAHECQERRPVGPVRVTSAVPGGAVTLNSKGPAGSPEPSNNVQTGLSPQQYRTRAGGGPAPGTDSRTREPSTRAVAN